MNWLLTLVFLLLPCRTHLRGDGAAPADEAPGVRLPDSREEPELNLAVACLSHRARWGE